MLQDNFVAELSAHYQNYILVVGSQACGLPVFMVNTLALDIYKGSVSPLGPVLSRPQACLAPSLGSLMALGRVSFVSPPC